MSYVEHGGPIAHCQVGKAQDDDHGPAHNAHGLQSLEGQTHQPGEEDGPLTAAGQLCSKGEPDSPKGPQGPRGGDPLGGGTPFGGGRAEFGAWNGHRVCEPAAGVLSSDKEVPQI